MKTATTVERAKAAAEGRLDQPRAAQDMVDDYLKVNSDLANLIYCDNYHLCHHYFFQKIGNKYLRGTCRERGSWYACHIRSGRQWIDA